MPVHNVIKFGIMNMNKHITGNLGPNQHWFVKFSAHNTMIWANIEYTSWVKTTYIYLSLVTVSQKELEAVYEEPDNIQQVRSKKDEHDNIQLEECPAYVENRKDDIKVEECPAHAHI